MNYQDLISGEDKKNIILSSSEFAHRVVMVKVTGIYYYYFYYYYFKKRL